MSFGTSEEYARSQAKEHQEIPLLYPGRGKLDVHAATEDILARAVRADEVLAGYVDLDTEMDARSLRIIAAHNTKRAARAAGHMVLRACRTYVTICADFKSLNDLLSSHEPVTE